ncbi:Endothelin-converting enzyme 1 [Halotydeus destructor]|nr:Endothelin-converting enzyme 1 [Halotydeus destructor]
MARYRKTEPEDEVNWTTSFPADITQHGGFVNLNSLTGNLLSPSSESVDQLDTEGQSSQQPAASNLVSPPNIHFFTKTSRLSFGQPGSRRRFSFKDRFHLLSRLSTLEVVLISLTILLLVLVLFLVFHDDGSPNRDFIRVSSHDHKEHCLTPACVTVAAAIINAMDVTVDPCQDFYKYSCGGWIKTNPLPDGKTIWGSFNKLWQENQLTMKNVLESQDTNSTSSVAEIKAKTYYHSCLDKDGVIEARGAQPLIDFLHEIGGWNISDDFEVDRFDYEERVSILHNQYNRGGGLFNWAVGVDEKNSSKYVIQLDQGGLTLPNRDYYLNRTENQKILDAYLEFMAAIGELLGADFNETKEQMAQVIDFETRLANITIPAEEKRDDEQQYHKMTLNELNDLAPALNWVTYFGSAFEPFNYSVNEHHELVVFSPNYISNLSSIILEYNSTRHGREILSNYFGWTVVQSLTSTLSRPFREASRRLRKELMGSESSDTKWRFCVTDTNSVVGFALGAMFVKQVFKGDSKVQAELMIKEIKTAFEDNLPNLEWMDEETRMNAQKKAEAITNMIGFPDFILNHEALDLKYEGLEFNETTYFENNIQVNMFLLAKNIGKMGKPTNVTEWEMTPPAVNAYYAPTKNQIVFPAGILQAPFYDAKYPKSLNFGAMGVVMGHELVHAFDDQGREYDEKGNLKPWWQNATVEEFKNKINCFSEQYTKYDINGDHINGKQTLGENIADNGGLKAAFRAYEDWSETHETELPLPGLNLTNKQLFFIGFSQVWCSISTHEEIKLQLKNDPHSPGMYRVIGTLSNSKVFSEHFSCPAGSPMNPVNKCDVW